jgi:glycosyltransferase involved in cell wall biosynthesis
MSVHEQPLVSILTPVYNGGLYLRECIESVLSQTYSNWEYNIVNNCSTDETLQIAEEYAKKDPRIHVLSNDKFLDVIGNHNKAFRLISADSKYCKVVSADDFIFPTCIEKLVKCAEANPSVGIVGCHQLSGNQVRWQGFKYPTAVFSGRELCRRIWLEGQFNFGFGSPTSLLYRADLVRRSPEFYPNPSPHSDTSGCFRDLHKCDFGFVYEVLAYEKTHEETQSSISLGLNRYASAYLNDLIQYGPAYLDERELDMLVNRELNGYHRFLAVSRIFGSRGKEFWQYHMMRLEELGYPLKGLWLPRAAVRMAVQEMVNPAQAIRKVWRRVSPKTTQSNAHNELSTRHL